MDLTMPEPVQYGQGWQSTRSSACLVRLRVMQTRPNSLKDRAFEGRLVLFESELQRGENFFAVAALFHVDEVDDDDAAEVAQTNLADDFLHGFEVGLDDGVFEARGTFADKLAGVDVDGDERFGVVDDDVAAGLQPHLGAQRLVEFVLDAELLEDRLLLGVELDAVDKPRLEAADEFDDLAVFLFVVNPDGGEIVADVIAQNAFDQVQVAVQQSGSACALRSSP